MLVYNILYCRLYSCSISLHRFVSNGNKNPIEIRSVKHYLYKICSSLQRYLKVLYILYIVHNMELLVMFKIRIFFMTLKLLIKYCSHDFLVWQLNILWLCKITRGQLNSHHTLFFRFKKLYYSQHAIDVYIHKLSCRTFQEILVCLFQNCYPANTV